jgi:hypothetical protein
MQRTLVDTHTHHGGTSLRLEHSEGNTLPGRWATTTVMSERERESELGREMDTNLAYREGLATCVVAPFQQE